MDTDEASDYTWGKQHELTYGLQMNRLYHHKRERFFSLMDKGGKALALICGTAGASALLPSANAKAAAGLAVAVVTLPGLVFAWPDRSRLHAELAGEYARLEAEVTTIGVLTLDQVNAFKGKALALGTKEPAGLSALLRICQNELAVAANQMDRVYPVPLWHRLLAHFIDFPADSLPVAK